MRERVQKRVVVIEVEEEECLSNVNPSFEVKEVEEEEVLQLLLK